MALVQYHTLLSTEIIKDATNLENFKNNSFTHLYQQFTFLCYRMDNLENANNENADRGNERVIMNV